MRALLLATATLGLLAAGAASAQTFSFTTLDNPGDTTFNQLLGINDNGTIVGYYGSGAHGHPNVAYAITAPYTTYQNYMFPASVQTQATGINNYNQTTGFWSPTNIGTGDANYGFERTQISGHPAFTSVTEPKSGVSPVVDQALGINNKGVVAGFYTAPSGSTYGFTYVLSTATYTAIGLPGATSDALTGINDSGETCGFYTTPTITGGFVRNANGSVVTKFSVPGSTFTQLLGINNAGVAVGFYLDGANVPHGLYYTPSTGNWTVVNDPNGANGTVVNGLNNKNQLVGFYTDAAGSVHGMIVTVTP